METYWQTLAAISYKHCWDSMIHCGANCFPSENYCIWQSALQRDGVQIKLGTWISKKIDEFCMVLSIFVHDFPFQRDAFFRFFQVPAVSVADSWSSSSRSAGPRNPSAELLMDLGVAIREPWGMSWKLKLRTRSFQTLNLKDNDTRWCWTEMNVVENYSIIYSSGPLVEPPAPPRKITIWLNVVKRSSLGRVSKI